VEDGDRKGFQSNKGRQGKVDAKISALTLPPRSPCFMPLDYAFWRRTEDKMAACDPTGTESKKCFIARLKKCAKGLSKAYPTKEIAMMSSSLQGVIDAKGYTAKND